ncbi:MAG TPA: GAF domain-containing protein [Labilithrix sp.]
MNDKTKAPEHPRVPDAVARAVLQSLLENPSTGIALVRANDWSHVMTSPTYERLVGVRQTLGKSVDDVLTRSTAPRAMLERVNATGEPATKLRERDTRLGGEPIPAHVRFLFLRVRNVTPESDGVLVLAEDVSREVHDQRIGELFVALANDMTSERDETASIRASVAHASQALGADAASIFLLSPDGKLLHGALVGWDWTRTSFVAELESWPDVKHAVGRNEAVYMTAATARLAEQDWFERRGIEAAICAPMAVQGRVLGVLFFDYGAALASHADLGLAKSIADQCAKLVDRAATVAANRASVVPPARG